MPDRILRVTAMRQKLGAIGRSTFHRMCKQPGFPPPVILSAGPKGIHGWRESEVDAWLASRPRIEGGK